MLRPKVLYVLQWVPWVNFDVVSDVCCGVVPCWSMLTHRPSYYHLLHAEGDAGGVSIAAGVSFVAWGCP